MKTLLIISLISLSLCDEITITAEKFEPKDGDATKVDISVKASANPGTTVATGLFKIKSTSGTSVALTGCSDFGSYNDATTALSTTCNLGTVANGDYNLVANSVTSGTNTLKVVVTGLTTALTVTSNSGAKATIAGNALTVSTITKTDSGASITFQAATPIAEAHSVEGLFVVTKDTTKVSLTCSLPVVAAANTDSTATCTIPSNTAAGDYVLQVNSDGVVSGTHKFTVALKGEITDADKTITISAAAAGDGAGAGAGNTNNKADFISFSKYLFTIFILFL